MAALAASLDLEGMAIELVMSAALETAAEAAGLAAAKRGQTTTMKRMKQEPLVQLGTVPAADPDSSAGSADVAGSAKWQSSGQAIAV